MIPLIHLKLQYKNTKWCEPNHLINAMSVRRMLRIHTIVNKLHLKHAHTFQFDLSA
jgi:hypothetical protein